MKDQEKTTGAYDTQYIPSIIKFGRATNLIGVVLGLLPALVLTLGYGVHPSGQALLGGIIMVASIEFVFWFVEPISYFPVLGLPATYMAFMSGNIGNLRMPVSAAAQTAAEVKQGSKQGTVIATIGVAVSVLVNVIILTAGVILGARALEVLPQSVSTTLAYIVPSLFGALLAQQVVSTPKIGAVGIVLAGGMLLLGKFGLLAWVPGDYTYVVMLVAVFGTMFIGKMMSAKSVEKEAQE